MENRQITEITEITEAQLEAQTEKDRNRKLFWCILLGSLGLILITFALFLRKQVVWFRWDLPVDSNLLVAVADFVSGILGTLLAVFSIWMLVRTLNAQMDSNAEVKDANEKLTKVNRQQLFDNKFQVYYAQYKDAVAGYGNSGAGGKTDLESVAAGFIAKPFTSGLVYSLRVKAAVKVFEEFYAQNRRACSVHFRVLYLLVRFIEEGKIREEDRVLYIKSIRGQLTDGELLLLRYNCLTDLGEAMRKYVNHFNLLKHISLMSLLEFKQWSKKLANDHEKAALDAVFIALRKMMKEMNDIDEENESQLEISPRYQIIISFEKRHHQMVLRLEENKKAKSGGPVKHPYAEVALKKIGDKELPDLFFAFLYESFITSNFELFENARNCVHTPIDVLNDANSFIFEIQVKGPQRLVLSQDQYTPSSRKS